MTLFFGTDVPSSQHRRGMNRFEQRLQKRLQKKAIAEGYRAMGAELELMHALDSIRKQQHMSQETLAALMGRKREAISRLFSADDSNPTLDTLLELLSALNLTADITLRQAREGEAPLKVATELTPP
jgi:DNA-binding phage protein